MPRYPPARGPPPVQPSRTPRVDREKTCPSLLRVFVNSNVHHPAAAYSTTSLPTRDEHQLYVWRDSSIREIVLLLRDASPALRSDPFARYSIKLVFWDDKDARHTMQDVAVISAKDLVASAGASDRRSAPAPSAGGGAGVGPAVLYKTLAEAKFVVGDYLDVAYIVPAPAPSPAVGGLAVGGANSAPLGPRGGSGLAPMGPRGAMEGLSIRGGAPGGGGGPRGPLGSFGGGMPRDRGDTWAPTTRGGAGPGGPMRGGFGVGGAAGGRFGPPGRQGPADAGWGARRGPRTNGQEDRDVPPASRRPRRSSRSLSPSTSRRPRSPSPGRSRSRSRSRSPGPPRGGRRDRDGPGRDRSPDRGGRSPPPHMRRDMARSSTREDEDVAMRY
ncbi:hypothetical protein JCM10212_001357 [Sporobolomyces blumeae]